MEYDENVAAMVTGAGAALEGREHGGDPTREDLNRLLWSDSASEAWEGDAASILGPDPHSVDDEDEAPGTAVRRMFGVVASEAGATEEAWNEDEDGPEDLRDLATSAKRLAILLLRAAWAAEKAAEEGT